MSLYIIQGAFDLGCMFGILSLGVFISFKVLNIPDMTVDGSFTLGATISGVVSLMGMPILGIFGAFIGGCIAGLLCAFLQTKLKIQPILSGILMMISLYSINLRILGNSPSLSLFGAETIFSSLDRNMQSLLILIILLVVALLLYLFLNTQLGLSLRACGDNEVMVRASSINTDVMKFIGLACANGLVSTAGALMAQYQVFADSSSGTGTLIIALASIIIGETLIRSFNLKIQLISVIIGAILYRFILTIALQFGVNPTDLKLLSALLVIAAISVPVLQEMRQRHKKRGAHRA